MQVFEAVKIKLEYLNPNSREKLLGAYKRILFKSGVECFGNILSFPC